MSVNDTLLVLTICSTFGVVSENLKQDHIENFNAILLQSNINNLVVGLAASLPEVGQVILDLDLAVGGVWSVGFIVQPMHLSLRAQHGDLVQS